MDSEILFGEIEETPPQPELRPDLNRHYSVVACGAPVEGELPIYVDLDVMRDMEGHAQTDTTVELGGVMLGGQYHDDQGRPFVVVTDSLRAQHYEATKGSFKFTHDTWQKISRERDQFPAELQMVGWYHTHPDWGVFLSGMDMFICDNFFNRPLDVALVIDPCRGDRGWFQWTGDPKHRVRRTGGFYLIASRFRQTELDLYSAQLEGRLAMPTDARYSGIAPPGGSYGAPIVNVMSDKGGQAWQPLAMFGLLSVQFLFLLLVAWKLLAPGTPVAHSQPSSAEIAALQESLDMQRATQRAAAKADAQLQVIDRVMGVLKETPENFAQKLESQQTENDQLQATVRGQLALERELNRKNVELVRKYDSAMNSAEQQQLDLDAQIRKLAKSLKAMESKYDEQKDELAKLNDELEKYRPKKDEAQGFAGWFQGWNLLWVGLSVGAVLLLAAGGVAAAFYRTPEEREEIEPQEAGPLPEEPRPPANRE